MTWSFLAKQNSQRLKGRCALALLTLGLCLSTTEAHAQVGKEKAVASPKGLIGTSLLGAEVVIAVEAAIGVQPWYWYAIGGGAGAIGGGVGGYFIDRAGNAPVSMSLFVGGLVLAVPTTIAMLNATTYKPAQNPEIDDGATAAERAEDRYYLATHSVPSLVDVNQTGRVSFRMPAIEISPVFSENVRKMYSLPSATAVEVPVLHLAF
jgi:hypothetical protein